MQSIASPPAAARQSGGDSFEVDLREALAATRVSELSYDEFLRALKQQSKHKPQ